MIRRLLDKYLVHNDIVIDDIAYMRRYWIFDGQKKRPSIRIHHILQPDGGRDLHDHPFDFISFIMKGGYEEVLPDTQKHRRRFSFGFRRATDFHRISRLNGDVWTLVFTSRSRRNWGFDFNGEWIKNQTYTTDRAYVTDKVKGVK